MDNETRVTISTKASADAIESITTNVILSWDNMEPNDIRALAQTAIVIKMQSKFRAMAKSGQAIPTEFTANAVDYRVGTRVARPKESIAEQINKLSEDERNRLIDQLMNG